MTLRQCEEEFIETARQHLHMFRFRVSGINNNNNFINCKWVDTRWQWRHPVAVEHTERKNYDYEAISFKKCVNF